MNELEVIKSKNSELVEVEKIFESIQEELLEINQNRSNFQLVHYVVERHGPLKAGAGHRQRQQALREMQIMRGEIMRIIIQRERNKRVIDRLRIGDSLDKDLDIAEKLVESANLEVDLIGMLREYKTLSEILKYSPVILMKNFKKRSHSIGSNGLKDRLCKVEFPR